MGIKHHFDARYIVLIWFWSWRWFDYPDTPTLSVRVGILRRRGKLKHIPPLPAWAKPQGLAWSPGWRMPRRSRRQEQLLTCRTEGGVHHLQGVELAHVDVNLNGNLLWWEILKWVVHVKICCGDTVCKRKWSKVEKIFLKGSIKNTKRSLKLDQVYCAWLSKGLLIMPVSGDLGGWHRSLTDTLTHTHTDNRI